MQEKLVVTDRDTIRALSDDVRFQILTLITRDGPLSSTEIAKRLQSTAQRIGYHIRILEKHGLIRLFDTIPHRNLVEKRFAAVARRIETRLPPTTVGKGGPPAGEPSQKALQDSAIALMVRELQEFAASGQGSGCYLSYTTFHLSRRTMKRAITEMLEQLRTEEKTERQPNEDERVDINLGLIAFEK